MNEFSYINDDSEIAITHFTVILPNVAKACVVVKSLAYLFSFISPICRTPIYFIQWRTYLSNSHIQWRSNAPMIIGVVFLPRISRLNWTRTLCIILSSLAFRSALDVLQSTEIITSQPTSSALSLSLHIRLLTFKGPKSISAQIWTLGVIHSSLILTLGSSIFCVCKEGQQGDFGEFACSSICQGKGLDKNSRSGCVSRMCLCK